MMDFPQPQYVFVQQMNELVQVQLMAQPRLHSISTFDAL
jgi:hypothetical protein